MKGGFSTLEGPEVRSSSSALPLAASEAATLGIGQVGLGQITEVHRDGYRSYGLRVVAGTDPSEKARDAFAGEMPDATVHRTVEDLLEDPKVEVVDVAAPHRADVRRPLLEQIFAAGKPVLLQKPFSQTYADALDYTRMAEAAGVPLMINQNSLFCGGVVDLAGRMTSDFGSLIWGAVRNTFFYDPAEHPYFGKGERWWITDMAIHELAVLHHFFGPPETVYAITGRDPHQTGVQGDGLFHAIFRYPNGASIVINEGGAYLGAEPGAFIFEFHGDLGTVGINPGKRVVWSLRDGKRMEEITKIRWFPEAFGLCMSHFQWCLRHGEAPLAGAADNLFVIAAAEAAYVSARERREVSVAEIMGDRWIADYGPGCFRGGRGWTPAEIQPHPRLIRDYAWATYTAPAK